MALVILDRQHVGKPDKLSDLGAWGDFDLDGKPAVVEQEAIITAKYGLACEIALRTLGHRVVWLCDGRYSDRHTRAKAYKADVYVALHLNAGKGDYAAVFHDHRSALGAGLARQVADEFTKVLCPPLKRVRAEASAPDNAWPRPYGCLAGVYDGTPVGILVEPAFIDNPDHKALLTDPIELDKIGAALAWGIHLWLRSRGK